MRDPWQHVTPALLRTMECLSRGLDTREIAFELSIKDETVKTYVSMLADIFDCPPDRDMRIILALTYQAQARNEIFRIGSELLRSEDSHSVDPRGRRRLNAALNSC